MVLVVALEAIVVVLLVNLLVEGLLLNPLLLYLLHPTLWLSAGVAELVSVGADPPEAAVLL